MLALVSAEDPVPMGIIAAPVDEYRVSQRVKSLSLGMNQVYRARISPKRLHENIEGSYICPCMCVCPSFICQNMGHNTGTSILISNDEWTQERMD